LGRQLLIGMPATVTSVPAIWVLVRRNMCSIKVSTNVDLLTSLSSNRKMSASGQPEYPCDEPAMLARTAEMLDARYSRRFSHRRGWPD
jgi:hypothetical protein